MINLSNLGKKKLQKFNLKLFCSHISYQFCSSNLLRPSSLFEIKSKRFMLATFTKNSSNAKSFIHKKYDWKTNDVTMTKMFVRRGFPDADLSKNRFCSFNSMTSEQVSSYAAGSPTFKYFDINSHTRVQAAHAQHRARFILARFKQHALALT